MKDPLYYRAAILNLILNIALFIMLAAYNVITKESVIMLGLSVVIYLFCNHVKNKS